MDEISIIPVRESPEYIDRAADYFSSKWNIAKSIYQDCIVNSITTDSPLPRWYLMIKNNDIIGGYGLIVNDYISRQDLWPWLCAVYVEKNERGKALGSRLLQHGRREAAKLGFSAVYLCTSHIGYYEKYDWRYIGGAYDLNGNETRVYKADAIKELEEMSAFFNIRADIYDSHMLDDLGLDSFYEAVSRCFGTPVKHLLDLGCGTGLELERLFERFPDMKVTGVDMSAEMLNQLEAKYPGKNLNLICDSYFNVNLGGLYDYVLSTYSLHHFDEDRKSELYAKIHAALKPEGLFVFGDYTVSTPERQKELQNASDIKRREQGIPEGGLYHFDTPFTPEAEMCLMKKAGFRFADIIRQWDSTSIIVAGK
ncbi:MAG: bifunctional GNAT family N-acetyltransferase/class I SAM-dependent methyltransferase [Eubacteriales bacterium]|nr:bifunctional GNAT family N-acetyltransferase/class I SAM-dependent methyltransferase [Eubacteriales bacterium]